MANLMSSISFFFNDTATTEIYTLSLHDALPISSAVPTLSITSGANLPAAQVGVQYRNPLTAAGQGVFQWIEGLFSFFRSEEHTSELQSHLNLVCRLLLEKKKQHTLSLLITFSLI